LFLINFLKVETIVSGKRVNEMRIEPFRELIKELNLKVFGVEL